MSPRHRLSLAVTAAVALTCVITTTLHAQSVLFVGNSFTFTPRAIGIGTATELNQGSHPGGVPELFQAIAALAGKNPTVTMETVGGKSLQFHYETKLGLIAKPWDIVILQDYSTGPLPDADGGHVSFDSFRTYVPKLKAAFVAQNPSVKIWLYETWARPDTVKKGQFPTMEAMQIALHKSFADAAHDFALQGYVPVGDSFLATVKQGLGDNPVTPAVEGPLAIWAKDDHHQSPTGSYLAALLFYGRIYDADPRALPTDNAAARHLKLSAEASQKLQAIAWEELQATK